MRWLQAILPKEERFFALFAEHAAAVVAGARALSTALEGGPSLNQHLKTVMDCEHEGDRITREVLLAVRRSFITPFDRGDIKDLITAMDDAIDQMRKTMKTVVLFNVTAFEPEMRRMAECAVEGARVVEQVVPLLRSVGTHATEISRLAARMSEIEGETDDLHDEARRRLFQKGPAHALDFWVASEILDHLESVMDRMEDVAHEVHSIVIEHV